MFISNVSELLVCICAALFISWNVGNTHSILWPGVEVSINFPMLVISTQQIFGRNRRTQVLYGALNVIRTFLVRASLYYQFAKANSGLTCERIAGPNFAV